MFDSPKTMDGYLQSSLEALKKEDTNEGLLQLVMALQEMSGRLSAIEEKIGVEYDK